MEIKHLSWDSDFFKIKIGRIDLNSDEKEKIQPLINKAISEGYQLLYLFADKETEILIDGKTVEPADIKRVYETSVGDKANSENIIADYTGECKDILSLALQSGLYSRFKTDPNFGPQSFVNLYKKWTESSVNKSIANYIAVIAEDENQAFGTLKIDGNKGVIGLFAVDENHRRKSLGKKIMQSIFNYVKEKNVDELEVATQRQNIEACLFYEKMGFKIKSETFIYHIWL